MIDEDEEQYFDKAASLRLLHIVLLFHGSAIEAPWRESELERQIG